MSAIGDFSQHLVFPAYLPDDLIMTLSQTPVVLLTHVQSLVTISLIMIKCYIDKILACVLLKIFGTVGGLLDRIFGAERVKI